MNINFKGTAVVAQDYHIPFQDQRSVREVELFMGELQPDLILHPGDMSDFYQLSKFDRNPNRGKGGTIQTECTMTAALFRRERELCPNARILVEPGNHWDRLRRYLWSKAPELSDLDCLQIESLMKLKESEIELIGADEGVLINGNFLVTHAEIVRAHSGWTAKGMSDKHGGSGMHGHTHRGGSYYKSNRSGVYGWWENFCLDLDTPILTADLRWMPLWTLKVGDNIIGFDEKPEMGKQRRLRNAKITSMKRVVLPSYEIVLEDGRTIVASGDHLWLRGDNQGCWVKTKNLRAGYKIRQIGSPWELSDDWRTGYLAGVLDGEGFCDGFTLDRPSIRVGFGQNNNELLDKSMDILEQMGIRCTTQGNKRNENIMVRASGTINAIRLLGLTRPPRLMSKLKMDGLGFPTKDGTVVIKSVSPIGERELISIETSTKTLFANGLASHNCLCDLNPDWIIHPNWQQGFSVVSFIHDRFWVEPVPIIKRKFIYGGRMYGSGGKKR